LRADPHRPDDETESPGFAPLVAYSIPAAMSYLNRYVFVPGVRELLWSRDL
jgi:hypothetical protein